MTDQVSRCPNCETSFKVSQSQLLAADGAVRCGACLQVFNAANYFVEAPIPDLFDHKDTSSIGNGSLEDLQSKQVPVDRDADLGNEPDEESSKELNKEPNEAFDDVHNKDSNERLVEEQGTFAHVSDAQSTSLPDSVPDGTLEADVDFEFEPEVASEVTGFANKNEQDRFYEPSNVDAEAVGGNSLDLDAAESLEPAEISSNSFVAGADAEKNHSTMGQASTLELATQATRGASQPVDLNISDSASGGFNGEQLDTGELEEHQFKEKLHNLETDEPDTLIGEFNHSNHRSSRGALWFLGALVLSICLVGQYLWFDRHYLANKPEVRPYYLQFCNLTNCKLLEFSDLSQLTTDGLVVRTHPVIENGLIVDALLRNEAPYRQAFPGLKLSFSDIKGRTLAQRIFKPSSYLAGEMAGLIFIPAATEVRLSIEIVDPGQAAVSYSMSAVSGPT